MRRHPVGIREVWLVLVPRRRWFPELGAAWDDLLRVPGSDCPKVNASSSGVEHWWRIASVAIVKGQRSVAAAKSIPDRNKTHKTLCIGSSAGCKAKCFPRRRLKSASDSISFCMFEIASIFFWGEEHQDVMGRDEGKLASKLLDRGFLVLGDVG